jgi:hypothetical protein
VSDWALSRLRRILFNKKAPWKGLGEAKKDDLLEYKGKIRKDLWDRFGLYAMRDLDIISGARRVNTRYGIGMDKGGIEVVYYDNKFYVSELFS